MTFTSTANRFSNQLDLHTAKNADPKLPRLALLLACVTLPGCFLEVVVPRGGDVVSASGNNDCAESTNCAIEVLDATFSESFTAVPAEGFEFLRWQSGDDFFCGEEATPVCTTSNAIFAGNAAAESFIAASFQTWYVMPVFEFVGIDTDNDGIKDHLDDDDDNDGVLDIDDGCPLDATRTSFCDTVFVDGTEWAQVDLFTNTSWNQINSVCPGGVCPSGATLNGLDMTGWRMASLAEVNALFNSYITPVSLHLGPGPDQYNALNSPYTEAFYADGWRGNVGTNPTSQTLSAMMYTTVSGDTTRVYLARVGEWEPANFLDHFKTDSTALKTNPSTTYGALFYRVP